RASWSEHIRRGRVSIVFRKQAFTKGSPRWMYVYLGRPMKSLVGRFPILSCARSPVNEAARLTGESSLSEEEIKKYAQDSFGQPIDSLYIYRLGEFQNARTPASLELLSVSFDFVPTPTAVPVSPKGVQRIDALLGLE